MKCQLIRVYEQIIINGKPAFRDGWKQDPSFTEEERERFRIHRRNGGTLDEWEAGIERLTSSTTK
jgi:hypothetical protein